jgi:hypothetical protein
MFYDAGGGLISQQDAASGLPGTVSTTWQQKGGTITTPSNAAGLRIQLYNYINSGWVAYDDVSLKQVGSGTNLVSNPGFESSGGRTEAKIASYPGTSLLRSIWGTAAPRSGSYGYALSNHAYGWLQSDLIAVSPSTQYDLYTYLRGELDAADSAGAWIVRAMFYDAGGGYIGLQNAASGEAGTVSITWQQKRSLGARSVYPADPL